MTWAQRELDLSPLFGSYPLCSVREPAYHPSHKVIAMSQAIGLRVRIELLDPDASYASPPPAGGWPVVEGRLVAAIPGAHGKMWYVLEIKGRLPDGFNPLSTQPERSLRKPLRYLFLSPAPAVPTAEVPADFIGETLAQGMTAPVLVMVASAPEKLPNAITLKNMEFPYLCSGTLQVLASI